MTKITFGSCLHQNSDQPIWSSLKNEQADLFIFLGDNIYADTTNPEVMQAKYLKLAKQPGYQALLDQTPVYATWDDHDYGQNDAGSTNPIKKAAEQIFLDFFAIPDGSPARLRPGIYQSYMLGTDDQQVQLILLDTRYFRGTPVKHASNEQCPATNYGQQFNKDESILGEAQWAWLEQELKKPARLRIIASSIQVIPEDHCWEKWANFPHERHKLFDLIARSQAKGVIFISGDRHFAEISKIQPDHVDYPLYEITSSGMNTKIYGEGELNQHRVTDDNFREQNYGVIKIDWNDEDPNLALVIKNKSGELLYRHNVEF